MEGARGNGPVLLHPPEPVLFGESRMQAVRSYSWLPLTVLWFGAAMSVAEIQTGGLIASAGYGSGLQAIILGHIIGACLLGLMGYMGFREGMPSLMCTRIAFGIRGSWLLSVANLLQLLGWTTVMIQQNSQAVSGITRQLWGVEATSAAIIGLGCLIALWAMWETAGKHTGNTVAVLMLGILSLLVSCTLWAKAGTADAARPAPVPAMSFAEAFELSLVMPLSWVPLVADYASRAKSAKAACLAPALGYLGGSLWMYLLGFAGALLTGEANPTPMMMAAGMGIAALGVLVLSTVATTFLDVYSVVATARNIAPGLNEKLTGLCAVALGTGAALFWNSELYISFLHVIGAVFAPLSAILFADYYLLRRDERHRAASVPSLLSLAAGVAGYAAFSAFGSPLGPSCSCLLLTLAVHVCLRKVVPATRVL